MYDIIIIGGGISGLNTALNLSKNKKVLLCEKNNSFGGRIYTDKFLINKEKYSLEAGAGRISKSHKQMINLIKKMNLYNKLVEIDAEEIPILDGFILTFLIINLEFFDKIVSTMKKAHELMSDGIL